MTSRTLPAWPLACCLLLASPAALASWFTAEGAFGFSFGDRVPFFSTRVQGGKASTWYHVKPPKPDPAFNLYLARIDSATSEIFELVGHATVSPQHARPPERFTAAERDEGRARANEAVQKLFEQLPAALREAAVPEKYIPLKWNIRVAPDVGTVMDTSSPDDTNTWAWAASISCKHIPREWALARRVLPELFETKK